MLADNIFRNSQHLDSDVRAEFENMFPLTSELMRSRFKSKDRVKIEIHGVFDIANIQSLAQLLGVIVTRHLAGRSTAFVGLGSSSYSNGNRCFEILDESVRNAQSFLGREAFHPATHTLSPIAQALVFGEEMARSIQQLGSTISDDQIVAHCKKPEPAGAAALAGFLLQKLDSDGLSVFEVAESLRKYGFDKESFLEFAGFMPNAEGSDSFIQGAFEEGPYMGELACDILQLLEFPLESLVKFGHSFRKDRVSVQSELPNKKGVCIYLTGDNAEQPNKDLVRRICILRLDFLNANLSYSELKTITESKSVAHLSSKILGKLRSSINNVF